MQNITPFLWFDNQAEEAVNFYVSIFSKYDSPDKITKIDHIARYDEAGAKASGKSVGSIMVMAFQLRGQSFTALNGGPYFQFNEAVSFVVNCDTQDEVNYFWDKLTEGGDESAQQCGWLKDKYGLSWQIVPLPFINILNSPDKETAAKAMSIMLRMKKLDINELEKLLGEGD